MSVYHDRQPKRTAHLKSCPFISSLRRLDLPSPASAPAASPLGSDAVALSRGRSGAPMESGLVAQMCESGGDVQLIAESSPEL